MDHFELLETDLLMNGQSILEDIGMGVEAYRNNDFETFGKQMGKIVKLATTANAKKAYAAKTWKDVYPKDNREMATEIIQGLLESANVGKFNFTNLLLCIYEADGAALDLYQSVEMLEDAWKKKNMEEAAEGAIGMIALYQAIEQALPVCKAIDSKSLDWTNVERIAKFSRCPKKTIKIVGENMVFNGVTITTDFMMAMKAFENKDYKEFGNLIGQTLNAATQPKDMFLY